MSELADNAATLDEDGDVEQPKSAREIAMEAIELANLKKLEAETGVKLIDQDEDEDHDEQIDAQLTVETPTEAPAPILVKVDGVEKAITQDELIRTYQKNAAADRRLEEATRLLREAELRAIQPVQVAQAIEPPPDSRGAIKEAFEKLIEGDSEAAANMLGELMTQRGGDQPTPTPAPSIDLDQIAAQLEERFDVNSAIRAVQTDYPDILADPDLEMLTALKVDKLVAAGQPRAQAILEVADAMYKSLGKTPTGRQSPTPIVQPNEKLLRKQQMDQIPVASSVAASPSDANSADDPRSVIQDMAARRLGQSLPKG